ncbi:MAG: copper ion binding protein, partial [Candidatus Poribacteria bacterium]
MNKRTDLPIGGMTCASCAARIEKGLSQIKGVMTANVNFATEKATIEYDADAVDESDFIKTVKGLGYQAGNAESVTIPIQGMSCASCVRKIEKALKAVDGVVSVNVNFGTEKATVEYYPSIVEVPKLLKAITDAGYTALEPTTEEETVDREKAAREREIKRLKRKFIVAASLGALALIVTYKKFLPGLSAISDGTTFYILFLLTLPVQFWAGWQFYVGTVAALRHKSADMNVLIAFGTTAAYIYSVVATFAPQIFTKAGIQPDVYYDTAAVIIALILLGRFLEAKAKGRTSEAIKKLMGLQAK